MSHTEESQHPVAQPSGGTRLPSNQGGSGGSSLGDGPPPKADGTIADAGDQDRVATVEPGHYGGGYGGQPRPSRHTRD